MTQIADIIKNAMVVIDDVRLTEQLKNNPALFYRRMCGYVDLALPLMSSPPELYDYVSEDYEAPSFADSLWVSTEESMSAETQYQTDCIGFDLCSVTMVAENGKKMIPYTQAEYDSETGIVTFPTQEAEGTIYEIDFYKDGSFADFTPQVMRLFALAIAVMWNERLDNNWLNIQPKIKDSSFETVNESNYIDKMTMRSKEKRLEFTDELKKFEQMLTYNRVVRQKKTLPNQN